MTEVKQNGTLTELEELYNGRYELECQINRARRTAETIGTYKFSRPDGSNSHLELDGLAGSEYIEAAVKVAEVRKRIKERALPILTGKLALVLDEISAHPYLQQLALSVADLHNYIREGYLSADVVRKAQSYLSDYKKDYESEEE